MRANPLALPLLALSLLALGPAAAQAQPAAPKQQCFHSSDIRGFNAVDDQHVYVSTGVRDVFELKLMGTCPDVDWTMKLALVTRGGNFICSGQDADLVVPSPIGAQRCPVSDIRKLTPAEVEALPPKARP